MVLFTRRAFLIAAAALAPAARIATRRTGATVSRAEFMRLSQRLVGNHQLDAQTGAIYLDALLAVPENRALLARLVRSPGADLDAAQKALEYIYAQLNK